jgi:cysteine synthase
MFHPQEREGTRRRQQVDTMIEGIGLSRSTANFEVGQEVIDDAVKVTDVQAMAMARWLVEKDGIFIGSSSAVNCKFRNFYIVTKRSFLPQRCCCRSNRFDTRPRPMCCNGAL